MKHFPFISSHRECQTVYRDLGLTAPNILRLSKKRGLRALYLDPKNFRALDLCSMIDDGHLWLG